MKKNSLVIVVMILLIIKCFLGCSVPSGEIKNWDSFSPVPFSGYICGFENTKCLLQLPFFYRSEDSICVDDIEEVSLCGDSVLIECSDVNILQSKTNEKLGYSLSTLTFRTNLPISGNYETRRICVNLRDGRVIERPIGCVFFVVTKGAIFNDSDIYASNFLINQLDYCSMKVTYANHSFEDVEITDVTYLNQMYNSVTIKKYADWECTSPEEGTWIPAGGKKTFVFSFIPNESFFPNDETKFLYLLPFVKLSSDTVTGLIQAQSQPLIIQPPFTEDFINKLLEGSS